MCICSFAWSCLSLHIENVDKELVAIEAEDLDVVYEEEQQEQHEFVGAVLAEEQTLETDFANPALQQGKPQFIFLNPESLQ